MPRDFMEEMCELAGVPVHESEQPDVLDEAVGKKDKAVIRAFLDRKAMEGAKLTTDGKSLDGMWMGGKGIAIWNPKGDGKGIIINELGSKAAQSVQNALRKVAPKAWIIEDDEMDEAAPGGLRFVCNKFGLTAEEGTKLLRLWKSRSRYEATSRAIEKFQMENGLSSRSPLVRGYIRDLILGKVKVENDEMDEVVTEYTGWGEGYRDFVKDKKFFDEDRAGGVYYARVQDDIRSPTRERVVRKAFADKWRKRYPRPVKDQGEYNERFEDGAPLAIWFVPKPYAKHKSDITSSPKVFTPVFEISQGALKAGWQ